VENLANYTFVCIMIWSCRLSYQASANSCWAV